MSRYACAALAAIILGSAFLSSPCWAQPQRIGTKRIISSGLNQPLGLVTTPSDNRNLYVYERGGQIKIFDQQTNRVLTRPFLDIRDRVQAGQDGGLAGVAFDPKFDDNGYVYVQYTDRSPRPNNRLSRFTMMADGSGLDPNSEHQILYVVQPHTAHNGNWIGFGPDGMLYFTLGDGGDQNDPNNSGQDTSTLLGSVLRLDVTDGRDDFPNDPAANYGIPADNPFVGVDGRDEIWAHGLRNPWRASFDRLTGDFYIGDTSQDTWEEVNFISASSSGGENFGWRLREGFVATPTGGVGGPKTPEMIDPAYAYHHGNGAFEGNSIIGGHVYRGPVQSPLLQGQYFFTDWTANTLWSIEVDSETGLMVEGSQRDWTGRLWPDEGSLNSIGGQGEDNLGNLYLLSLSGDVYKFVPEPSAAMLAAAALVVGVVLRTRRRLPA